MKIEDAIDHWLKEKLLTKKKADELRANLPDTSADAHAKAIAIFSAVGAVLVGLGIILFVGSNWADLLPVTKVALLLGSMMLTGVPGYVLAYERPSYPKTGLALLFVNALAFGATIFLVAQIYHLPLTYWWGAFLWFAGVTLFAYILRSRLHLFLSILLLLLTLGWLRTSFTSAGEFDFLSDGHSSLLALLPMIGAGIVSLGILHRRSAFLRFGSTLLFNWGLFLVLLILVISTADKTVFFQFLRFPADPFSWTVLAACVACFLAAVIWGTFETKQGRWGLTALALYLLFLSLLAYLPQWLWGDAGVDVRTFLFNGNVDALTGLFVIHILLVFVFLLTIVWYGTVLRIPAVINLGMIGLAVTIILQYFSWAFELLPRSFAFIIGGILILLLGGVLERQRRKLVSSL